MSPYISIFVAGSIVITIRILSEPYYIPNDYALIKKVTRLFDYYFKNSNTAYYNLMNDRSHSVADFYDADHLNEIGAKKPTLQLD